MSREDRHLNVVVDKELDAYVRARCTETGMTISQVIRDALRAYFGTAKTPIERGWREGYTAAYRTAIDKVRAAFSELPAEPPAPGAPAAAARRGRPVAGP